MTTNIQITQSMADAGAEILYGHTRAESREYDEEGRIDLFAESASEIYRAMAAVTPDVPSFDMLAHLARQREWSERTFGPGSRAKGVIDHIRKELIEIESAPADLTEWIDVVILALDGAWRAGGSPQQIIDTIVAKQTKNEGRRWPDWRTAPPDKTIEHVRTEDAPPGAKAVSLTDEQRIAIQECIEYLAPAAADFADLGMLGMGDSKHARCIRTLRALLAAQDNCNGAGK